MSLGMGAMLGYLGGNEKTIKAIEAAKGKTIAGLSCDSDELVFIFSDQSRLKVRDEGQSCCENRYMTCDDDLSHFVGSTLSGFEIRDGGEVDSRYECHDTQFLITNTSAGQFTCCTHNEHNGYYGGFWIVADYTEGH